MSSDVISQESLIAHYKFNQSYGQIIIDQSCNSYHSVLGSTLLKEEIDPVLTDRGAYFDYYSYLTLPPNALLPKTSVTLTNFYLVFYVYVAYYGKILSIYEEDSLALNLKVAENSLFLYYQDGGDEKYLQHNNIEYGKI